MLGVQFGHPEESRICCKLNGKVKDKRENKIQTIGVKNNDTNKRRIIVNNKKIDRFKGTKTKSKKDRG